MNFKKPSHQTKTGSANFPAFGGLSSLWREGKPKLLISIIVIASMLAFVFSSSAVTLSPGIFPDTLDGLPLYEIIEETEEQFSYPEIIEAYWVDYLAEDWSREIVVLFWRLEDEESAQRISQGLISDMKADYSEMFDSVDWGTPQTVDIKGYQAIGINYTAYIDTDYLNGGMMSVAVGEYVIAVSVMKIETRPSMAEMKRALEVLVGIILGEGLELDVDFPGTLNGVPLDLIQEESPSEDIPIGFLASYENEQTLITVLFWQAKDEETAKEVERDTASELEAYYRALFDSVDWGTSQTVDIKGYQSTAVSFKLYAEGEQIDGGVILLAIREYFLLVQILDREKAPSLSELKNALEVFVVQVPGTGSECVYDYDCPEGVCTSENLCIKLKSEEFQEVKDKEIINKIYEDQTSYKKEYVDSYNEVEDSITTEMEIKDADLDVKLEVQGNTAGEVLKATKGEPIEVRLEIENNSSDQVVLAAGILYPDDFDLDEKKYTVSFDWEGELSSLIGSFEIELTDGKFIVMPPGSKVYVYSKVVPEETGDLDVQGLIYYATEEKYQKMAPGFLTDIPDDYEESEISSSILAEKKPCNWWPICM